MSQLQSSFFKLDRRGAVVHLAMNRPDRSNAMSQDFWADLPRLMRELAGDGTVRCVVISGEGRNFSGGMDLQAFAGISKLFDSEPGRGTRFTIELPAPPRLKKHEAVPLGPPKK